MARHHIGRGQTRIVAAGILVMGAMPMLTGGAAALAEKLPGGSATAIVIVIAEIIAVVLMFVLKATLLRSGVAAAIMVGRGREPHRRPRRNGGMEGEMATMFGMAVVPFLAAATASALAWRRGMGIVPSWARTAVS